MKHHHFLIAAAVVSSSVMAACALDFGSFQFANTIAAGGSGGTGGAGGSGGSCAPFCTGGGTNPGGMGGTNPGGMGGTNPGGMGGTNPGGMGGMGGGVTCNNPNQCPGMDADCEFRTCENNVCGIDVAASGAPCSDNGGNICDGMGNCVPCGNPPAAPGGMMCPAACTGGCNGNTCVILCDEANECANAMLTCPADYDCNVACTAANACSNATITCQSTYQCTIVCNAADACSNATVNCSMDGPCALSCGNMDCPNAALNCGNDECQTTCAGGANFPTTNCNNSCNCTSC